MQLLFSRLLVLARELEEFRTFLHFNLTAFKFKPDWEFELELSQIEIRTQQCFLAGCVILLVPSQSQPLSLSNFAPRIPLGGHRELRLLLRRTKTRTLEAFTTIRLRSIPTCCNYMKAGKRSCLVQRTSSSLSALVSLFWYQGELSACVYLVCPCVDRTNWGGPIGRETNPIQNFHNNRLGSTGSEVEGRRPSFALLTLPPSLAWLAKQSRAKREAREMFRLGRIRVRVRVREPEWALIWSKWSVHSNTGYCWVLFAAIARVTAKLCFCHHHQRHQCFTFNCIARLP